jgi:hypothetical protein
MGKKERIFENNIYSLDMLRINFYISVDDVQSYLDSVQYDIRFTYREMFGISAYRHNFRVECDNGHSFWIGLCVNSEKNTNKFRTCTIEFNPCKVGCEMLLINHYLKLLSLSKVPPMVKRFDLAIDIPVDREKCHLIKDKRTYQEYKNSNSDLTQYLGHRSSGGFVKLYNKAKELGLGDYGLTRFELTVDWEFKDYNSVKEFMPVVYVFDDYQMDMTITGTDKVLLVACLGDMCLLDELSRKKKEKIRSIIDGHALTLTLNESEYNNILSQIDDWVNGKIL